MDNKKKYKIFRIIFYTCFLCFLTFYIAGESGYYEYNERVSYKTVTEEIISSNQDLNTINLSVASRDLPGKLLEI